MKYLLSSLLFLILSVISSCSGDNEETGPYAGIPSGEIVAVDQRYITLVGIAPTGGRTLAVGQKWWKSTSGQVKYYGTCDLETKDITQTNTYYAFAPGGTLKIRLGIDGIAENYGSWQLEDNDDAIQINRANHNGKFEFRALNDNEVVYSLEVIDGECTQITWERLSEPFSE